MVAESSWNAASLFDAFYNGLSNRIKDELAGRDLPADLDALIALAIQIDARLREREEGEGPDSCPTGLAAKPFPRALV